MTELYVVAGTGIVMVALMAYSNIAVARINAQRERETLDRFLAKSPFELMGVPTGGVFPPIPSEATSDEDEAALRAAREQYEKDEAARVAAFHSFVVSQGERDESPQE